MLQIINVVNVNDVINFSLFFLKEQKSFVTVKYKNIVINGGDSTICCTIDKESKLFTLYSCISCFEFTVKLNKIRVSSEILSDGLMDERSRVQQTIIVTYFNGIFNGIQTVGTTIRLTEHKIVKRVLRQH